MSHELSLSQGMKFPDTIRACCKVTLSWKHDFSISVYRQFVVPINSIVRLWHMNVMYFWQTELPDTIFACWNSYSELEAGLSISVRRDFAVRTKPIVQYMCTNPCILGKWNLLTEFLGTAAVTASKKHSFSILLCPDFAIGRNSIVRF